MIKRLQLLILFFSIFCFSQEPVDGIAAIVGENIILKSDVDQFARLTASQMGINPTKDMDSYNKLLKQSLNALIDENVLLEQAKIETIEVKDRDVDNMLNQQIENMIFQAGSKENAEKILGNTISKTKRDYRPMIKNRLITEKLRNEKFSKIHITRREVDDFYKTFKDSIPEIPPTLDFSQIFFKIKPGFREENAAKHKADSLHNVLINGGDFSELAQKYSDDIASAKYGGDLGFIARGGFIKEFEEVAFSLDKNEISNVVKTEFGYHIIQLLDRKGENINVRHVLIKPVVSENNIKSIKQLADSVYENLITNKISFDSAAVLYSDDPDVKVNKGRIQRISKSQIQQQEFLAVLDTIKIGNISFVFKTELGYHILKLNGLYDDSWTTIEQWALEYKKSNLYEEWISQLRSEFNIELKVSY
ncbi:MAG TPA: hypothetical protein DHW42_02710 [Candidatus Marinimicrobia bacterium]|nr:hypothetical protein [Candidatus Neomarinimicrobiota bacterium]